MKLKITLINIIKLLISFLIFENSNIFVIPLKWIFNLNDKLSTSASYILTTYKYVCIIIIIFLMYRKELINEWKKFTSKLGKNVDIAIKYYFIGLMGMMLFNIILNIFLKLGGPQNEKQVQSMIDASPILMLVCAGILGPITEELIFRKAFKNVFTKKWIFIIISGFVFGAMHIVGYFDNSPLEIFYLLPYGFLGGCLAVMDYEVDSVFPSISMHMLHNTVLTLISILL